METYLEMPLLPYLRFACRVHTLNLILNDFINNNETMKIVIQEFKNQQLNKSHETSNEI